MEVDEEDEVDMAEAEAAEESRVHQLMGLKKIYYKAKKDMITVQRAQELRKLMRRLQYLRQRRAERRAAGEVRRRRRRNSNIDRPIRGRDICWGCGQRFFMQRVRRWLRCEYCNLWLCPCCNSQPVHCQNPM